MKSCGVICSGVVVVLLAVVAGSATSSKEEPSLKLGASIDLEGQKRVLTRLDTLPYVESADTKRFEFESADNPKLKELRESHKLADVVAPGKDEFDRQVLLLDWVHHRFKKFGRPTSDACGALAIQFGVAGPVSTAEVAVEEETGKSPYAAWKNGVPADADFFPIAVWLQSPGAAPRYKAAGFNLYVGLWKGPTEQQLAELKKHGMRVICAQNEVGLKHKDDATIVGWMHGDEPDNAQSLGEGKGYGPPILPAKIIDNYRKLKEADSSRPILLNLGQGVAWDQYRGRGVRTNHPEDYAEYVKGSDLVSFDIYPACHENREVAGKLWFVADGVARLRKWSDDHKVVWNCIECTHISNPTVKATPQQVKAEVWMSLVRGSRGLIYFVHQFKPKFIEAGLFADEEMLARVTEINQQIQRLAPVLNSPAMPNGVAVESSSKEAPVEAMARHHGGALYLFAVGMRDGKTTASFTVPGMKGQARAEVLHERRTLEVVDGVFHDTFEPWDVHLYKIATE